MLEKNVLLRVLQESSSISKAAPDSALMPVSKKTKLSARKTVSLMTGDISLSFTLPDPQLYTLTDILPSLLTIINSEKPSMAKIGKSIASKMNEMTTILAREKP